MSAAGEHPAVLRVRQYFAAYLRSDSPVYADQWIYPAALWADGTWSVTADRATMARNNEAYELAQRERGMTDGQVLELRCEPLSDSAALVHGRFDSRRADGSVIAVTETIYTVVRSGSDWKIAVCIVKR